jgi:hypothetical protein
VESRGTEVAEDGALAVRENRRHPSPVTRQPAAPDGEDTSKAGVQDAGLDAVLDCAPPQTHRNQLSARDYAVLCVRQAYDRFMIEFCPHIGLFSITIGHDPTLAENV